MPTFLLQTKLEILAEELTAAIPEKAAEYQKLRAAARDLEEARRRFLTDDETAVLASDFAVAVGAAGTSRVPHAATLLSCAVADEFGGAAGAVTSLKPWMTNAERFTPEWIVAVHETLRRARDLAMTRGTGPAPALEGW